MKVNPDHQSGARFLSLNQLVRIAVASYYQACRDILPPPSDPSPEAWADASDFADALLFAIVNSVRDFAADVELIRRTGGKVTFASGRIFSSHELNGLPLSSGAVHNGLVTGVDNG